MNHWNLIAQLRKRKITFHIHQQKHHNKEPQIPAVVQYYLVLFNFKPLNTEIQLNK
jgi:hypothetical protein